jgi:hypothetical protein
LKNTYGDIAVSLNGTMINSGKMFLGLFAGDHTKTGINTTLNTGTVLGPCANVFGGGMPPKEVPGFSWGGAAGFEVYDVEKALAVATTVRSRRSLPTSAAYAELFRSVYKECRHD